MSLHPLAPESFANYVIVTTVSAWGGFELYAADHPVWTGLAWGFAALGIAMIVGMAIAEQKERDFRELARLLLVSLLIALYLIALGKTSLWLWSQGQHELALVVPVGGFIALIVAVFTIMRALEAWEERQRK